MIRADFVRSLMPEMSVVKSLAKAATIESTYPAGLLPPSPRSIAPAIILMSFAPANTVTSVASRLTNGTSCWMKFAEHVGSADLHGQILESPADDRRGDAELWRSQR